MMSFMRFTWKNTQENVDGEMESEENRTFGKV